MTKKTLFLSVAASLAGAAIAGVVAAHKQGKLEPTLARAKQSKLVTNAIKTFGQLRDRFTGFNDNDFRGENATERRAAAG